MKRNGLFSLIGCLLLSGMFSCSSEELVEESDNRQITIVASDYVYDEESRTNIGISNTGGSFTWAQNDTVGIFPTKGHQVDFPMANGAGTKEASFNGGGWALKSSSSYSAYYPFIGNIYLDKTDIPVNFDGQIQEGNASTAHLGVCDYMAAPPTLPQGQNIILRFKHLGSIVQLRFVLPKKGDVTSVTLSADEAVFINQGKVNLTDAGLKIQPVKCTSSMKVNVKSLTTAADNTEVKVYCVLAPVDLSNKTIRAEVVSNGVKYKGVAKTKNMLAGRLYDMPITFENQNPTSTVLQVKTAGTLHQVISAVDKTQLHELKLSGNLNGTDIRLIREMVGVDFYGNRKEGTVTSLNLYDANIVEGGESYCAGDHFTKNNEIGDEMFTNSILESVVLPKTLTAVGRSAFSGSDRLSTVGMSENLKSIGDWAFSSCSSLGEAILPTGVETLGDAAFSQSGIKKLYVPQGVKTIPSYFCDRCTNLSEVNLPTGLNSIGEEAFNECKSLQNVILPDGLSEMGREAFSNTGLQEIKIPDGIKILDWYVFSNNSQLKRVVLPSNLKEIHGSFSGCRRLEAIDLPAGLKVIGNDAFHGCEKLNNVVLPEGVESIGNNAFYLCSSIFKMVIPCSVQSIGNYAFYACGGMYSLTLNRGLLSIGNNAFQGCGITEVLLPEGLKTLGSEALKGCGRLEKLILPNSVEKCGFQFASYCDNLTTVKLSAKLTEIPMYAFYQDRKLKVVDIPMGIKSIGDGAFCETPLEVATLPGGLETIGQKAFLGTHLKEFVLSNTVRSIGNEAFAGTLVQKVVLPNKLNTISYGLFQGCRQLSSIDIPSSVKKIEGNAFDLCLKLNYLEIPSSVEEIGWNAFSRMGDGTVIKIKGKITILESEVFNDSFLEAVYLPSTLKVIQGDVFNYVRHSDGTYKNGIKNIYCFAVEPPALGFENKVLPVCKIYVPKGSVEKYRNADIWTNFKTQIFEMPAGVTE